MFGGPRLLLILASLFVLSIMVSAADDKSSANGAPPVAKAQPVEDVLHGHKIVDNYRWLEDGTSSDTRAWVEGQLAYTRGMLDPLAGREQIQKRLTELLSVGTIGAPQIAGPYFIYTKREGMQNQPIVYVREGLTAVSGRAVPASGRRLRCSPWWPAIARHVVAVNPPEHARAHHHSCRNPADHAWS